MRGLIFGLALAGAISTGEAARGAPATVSELTVMPEARCLPARRDAAAPPPRIVGTFPAQGAVVRPGRLVLRVTFDRPMTCSGFFLARPPLRHPCPGGRQKMVQSFDHRTVRLVCATAPNTAYGLRIGDTAFHRFVSLDGLATEPHDLTFSTSSGPAVSTTPEALGEDR